MDEDLQKFIEKAEAIRETGPLSEFDRMVVAALNEIERLKEVIAARSH